MLSRSARLLRALPRVSRSLRLSSTALPSSFPTVAAVRPQLSLRLISNTADAAAAASTPASAAAGGVDAAVQADPSTHIDNFDISPQIKAALRQNFKIENLFPIQAECYTPVVEGKDLIGRSKTGSGKTLAFVLPVVQRLKQFAPLPLPVTTRGRYMHVEDAKCRVLILEPTRELANQVNNEIQKLAHVRTAVLYGGASSSEQARALARGSDLVVATPGRLLDMVTRGTLSLSEVKTIVLDEADEMLRMGFQEQVERIMEQLPAEKQVLLFSATMPAWVRQAAARYLHDAVEVDKVTGYENTTPSTITHKAMAVTPQLSDTAALLKDLFAVNGVARAICFTRTKRDASALSELLHRAGIRSRDLHGDVPQHMRDRTMYDFRQGRFLALVATDVAARGIDVPNVDMVVNVGFPDDHAFYVHRSGRTGRAGKKGVSLLLYAPEERRKIKDLTKQIGASFQQMAMPTEHNGKVYTPRSLLSGKAGWVTVEARGRNLDPLFLESQLRTLTGNPTLLVGKVESAADSSFFDLPAEAAQTLQAELEKNQTLPLRLATELPEEMFGGLNVDWGRMQRKSGGGRGGRGGFGGRGGGRGGGFGRGDRFGERGGDRGGDRYGGGSGFGRGDRFGERPSYGRREDGGSRYGNRDGASRYGGAPRDGGFGGFGGQRQGESGGF